MLNLKDITLDTKDAVMEFPGFPDFKITVSFISKQTAKRILNDSEKPVLRNGIQVSTSRDEDKFSQLFANAALKDWKGLTIETLSHLLLIDTAGLDLKEEVPFSVDNAAQLLSNSPAFSSFVDSAVYDLETFRSK